MRHFWIGLLVSIAVVGCTGTAKERVPESQLTLEDVAKSFPGWPAPPATEYARLLGNWSGYYTDGTWEWKLLMTFSDIRHREWVDGSYIIHAQGGTPGGPWTGTFTGRFDGKLIKIHPWMTLEWDGSDHMTGTRHGSQRPAQIFLQKR